ncbi:Efhb [Symbiodinium natans]|uniref:Efhb protein n=1 Tax=Symbiodinium natans TaxID=878477 RepID=A0A812KCP1_9DINO|nr:Efhb [Symbiodinium natans]
MLQTLLPDADLGKCLTAGRRNYETDPRGVPSVRFDKTAPPLEKRSVANATNYGDDLHAGSLITPTRFQSLGVHPQDFLQKRPVAEVASLLRGAGFCAEEQKLEAILTRAGCEDGAGRASLEDALGAIEEWLSTEG